MKIKLTLVILIILQLSCKNDTDKQIKPSNSGIQKVEKRSDAEGKLQLRTNIWRYNVGFTSGDDKTGHPAVFPIHLAQDHILSWSNEGDTVLDPFMGSGTTAIACINTKRNYIGFELDKQYCEIANERIRKAVDEKEVGK